MSSSTEQQVQILNIQNIQNTYLHYASLILTPLGVILNIGSMLVFLRKKLRKSATAIFNIVFAVVNIAILLLFGLEYYLTSIELEHKSEWFCKSYNYSTRVLVHIASWIQVALTIDRTLEVSFSRRFHISRNKLITLVVSLAILAMILGANFGNLVISYVKNQRNVTSGNVSQILTSFSCTSSIGILLSRDIISLLLRTIIPFAAMLVANIILIRTIIRSKKNVKRHSNTNGQTNNFTRKAIHLAKSIFALDVVFVITNSPVAIGLILLDVYTYFSLGTTLDLTIIYFFQYLCGYFGALNFIFPFLINLKFNKIFRKEFIGMILEPIDALAPNSWPSKKRHTSQVAESNRNNSSVLTSGKPTFKTAHRLTIY